MVIMNQEEGNKMTPEVFQQLIDKARNDEEAQEQLAQAGEDEDEDEDLNDSEQYDEV